MKKQFGEKKITAFFKTDRDVLMNDSTTIEPQNGRRKLLLGGLAASAAGLLQACGGGGSSDSMSESAAATQDATQNTAQADGAYEAGMESDTVTAATTTTTPTTPAPIPANQVNLADFGGVPGAAASTIVNAFNQAFTRLKSLGGGTLVVNPGIYFVGSFAAGTAISASNLTNILISGYGAEIQTNTTSGTSIIFNFYNPNNVTVAGMKFYDRGADINATWKGAVCLWVNSTTRCSGFKTVDCTAENVVSFVSSDTRSNPYLFEGFDIGGTIRNSYYGIDILANGRYSVVNLNCLNVRRAVILHSPRDWNITVTTNRTDGPGSNAHVVLSCFANRPAMDCNVKIIASGALNGYNCLGTVIHQSGDGVYSYGRNIKFNIDVRNATSAANVGFISFTAEPESGGGIRSSTVCAWENITVQGTVTGSYNGAIVANPTRSSASTNLIQVADNLATYQNMGSLPSYFKVFTPPTQCS